MAITHNRKIRNSQLLLDGQAFHSQCSNFVLDTGQGDAEQFHTIDPDSSFAEEAEAEPKLTLTLYSDWRSTGVTAWLWAHRGETLPFQLDHHVDIVGEHVRFSGSVQIKAPTVGGDARATETSEVEMTVVGDIDYERIG